MAQVVPPDVTACSHYGTSNSCFGSAWCLVASHLDLPLIATSNSSLFWMVQIAVSHSCVLDAVSGSILVPPSKTILPTEPRPWKLEKYMSGSSFIFFTWTKTPAFINRKKLLESSIKAQGIVIKLYSGLQCGLCPLLTGHTLLLSDFFIFPSSSTSYTYLAWTLAFLPAHTKQQPRQQNVPQWSSPNLKPILCST